MNKKTLAIILCLVVLVAGAWWVFYLRPASVFEIHSNDGKLTLTIPHGALPEGVRASDITMEKVEHVAPKKGYAKTLAHYRLLPENLKFLSPVVFEVTQLPVNVIPFILLWNEKEHTLEAPANLVIEFNKDRTLSAKGTIAHFSNLIVGESITFDFDNAKVTNEGGTIRVIVPEGTRLLPFQVSSTPGMNIEIKFDSLDVDDDNAGHEVDMMVKYWSSKHPDPLSRIISVLEANIGEIDDESAYTIWFMYNSKSLGEGQRVGALLGLSGAWSGEALNIDNNPKIFIGNIDFRVPIVGLELLNENYFRIEPASTLPSDHIIDILEKERKEEMNPAKKVEVEAGATVCGLPGGPACPKR